MTRVTVHVGGSRQMRTRSRSLRGPQWKAKWSQTRLISGWHPSGLFSGVVQSSRTPPGLLSGTPYCPPTCPPVHAFAFVKRTLQLLLLPALLCFACCSLMTHCRLVSKLRWWVSVTDDVKIPTIMPQTQKANTPEISAQKVQVQLLRLRQFEEEEERRTRRGEAVKRFAY